MLHLRELFQLRKLGHLHRTVFTNFAQIIAQQVYDHDILGPVLAAAQQLVGAGFIFNQSRAAGAGALDRPGFDHSALHAQEAFRRGAGDDEFAEVEIPGKGRGVALTQTTIQLERRKRRRIKQALGEVDLKAVARVDVFDGPAGGGKVCRTIEVAGQLRQ